MAIKTLTDQERLLSKRDITESGCWEFTGNRNKLGYGWFSIGSRSDGTRKSIQAHRASYLLFKGAIEQGLHLDHLCRNTSCFNPDHLEPVTPKVNIQRGTPYRKHESYGIHNRLKMECKNGHSLEVIYIRDGKPMRGCRSCRSAVSKQWQINRKGI